MRSPFLVVFILVIWFVISFVTNIIGPLMPEVIDSFGLSLTMAAFLPFSFFLAYGIASIPAGFVIERWGMKRGMLTAFGLNFLGAITFYLVPVYGPVLASLFVIGAGMAMLQVVINPLMRTAGGEENFAFFSVMGQLVFGLASFVSPFAFTYIMTDVSTAAEGSGEGISALLASMAPAELPWVLLYGGFAVVFAVIIAVVSMMRLPQLELKEDEKFEGWGIYGRLLKNRLVILFFLGIVAYVGLEQGLANWMSEFMNVVHGVDPDTEGAAMVGRFWGLMSLGCLLGLALLKILDSKVVLRLFTVLAIACVIAALTASRDIALLAFPMAGFFLSVMFSMIFSLALNSVTEHHGGFSGILCTGIFGGALVPLIIGGLGDMMSLQVAMWFLLIPLLYIGSISFWADPLIQNKRFSMSDD